MTGRRPDTTKVWEFVGEPRPHPTPAPGAPPERTPYPPPRHSPPVDHFRELGVGRDWVSMPQFFKQHGYLTLGNGKLYHPSSAQENIGMPFMDWPASWSPEYPYFFPRDDPGGDNRTCAAQGPDVLPPGSPPAEKFVWCALEVKKDDSVLFGQQIRDKCIADLELAANRSRGAGAGRPFFVGCGEPEPATPARPRPSLTPAAGFHKPHAPYYAPKEFFDRLPPPEQVPLPLDTFAPVGMPTVAWHPYADVKGMVEHPQFNGTVNMTRLHVYRRAYYAAISYTDYNIGRILARLDALGLAASTAVVVFGDHGYQLGMAEPPLPPTPWR